jgi:hypothetical protein
VHPHSCLLWRLVVRDFPLPPLFGAQVAPHSLLYASSLTAYYSVFFSFFPGWGSVCAGGYADLAQGFLWEYCMPLSSPCCLCLPKPYGCWREPFWFLHLMWSGDAMHRLGVWRSQSFASSRWFFL